MSMEVTRTPMVSRMMAAIVDVATAAIVVGAILQSPTA